MFGNFSNKRAIVEIPYKDINWTGNQGHISYIESFGYETPYLLILNESHQNSMMTRSEILAAKARFPGKKIIMNTRRWQEDKEHVESVQDILDGVCIEFIPTNGPPEIDKHVSPFFEWAYNNDKVLMFLMPPQPIDHEDDRYQKGVIRAVQTIYDYNKDRLPKGWMKRDTFFFLPANYTYGRSQIHYVPEDASNTILSTAKALMKMRPYFDAEPDPAPAVDWLSPLWFLLD